MTTTMTATETNTPQQALNITLSDAAKERMKSFLEARGKGIGIRIGIQTAGCSGMAYVIEFVDQLADDDVTMNYDGVTLVVSQKALIYLQNVEVDYRKEGLNEGFRFINPNAAGECGCGESFTI